MQRPMHHLEDQRQAIRDTIAVIREFTGKAPRGWESPGLTETVITSYSIHYTKLYEG